MKSRVISWRYQRPGRSRGARISPTPPAKALRPRTNTGTSAVKGWSLAFTLPSGQSITSGWNATYSPTTGQVTATNAAYNGTIPAGGSVTIGYQATHTGGSGAPTSFTLNGSTCTTS